MVSMTHRMLGACLFIAFGCYIFWFARRTARDPRSYIENWQPWLPLKRWAYRAVRILAMFWMWGAFLMIGGAVAEFVPLWKAHTPRSAIALFAALAVVTLLVTPKQQQYSSR
jgi:hypothetical protein